MVRFGRYLLQMAIAHPYATCVIVYLFIVAACTWRLVGLSEERHLHQAAAELTKNHRVTASDLQRPSGWVGSLGFYLPPAAEIQGRYVKNDRIAKGAPIGASALLEKPDIAVVKPNVGLLIPIVTADTRLLSQLSVGTALMLVGQGGDRTIMYPATLRAIVCEAKGANCQPFVEVSENDVTGVVKNLTALRLTVRPPSDP